jgi:hypothetical protein
LSFPENKVCSVADEIKSDAEALLLGDLFDFGSNIKP